MDSLPDHLVVAIADHLSTIEERFAFSCVCRRLRQVVDPLDVRHLDSPRHRIYAVADLVHARRAFEMRTDTDVSEWTPSFGLPRRRQCIVVTPGPDPHELTVKQWCHRRYKTAVLTPYQTYTFLADRFVQYLYDPSVVVVMQLV